MATPGYAPEPLYTKPPEGNGTPDIHAIRESLRAAQAQAEERDRLCSVAELLTITTATSPKTAAAEKLDGARAAQFRAERALDAAESALSTKRSELESAHQVVSDAAAAQTRGRMYNPPPGLMARAYADEHKCSIEDALVKVGRGGSLDVAGAVALRSRADLAVGEQEAIVAAHREALERAQSETAQVEQRVAPSADAAADAVRRVAAARHRAAALFEKVSPKVRELGAAIADWRQAVDATRAHFSATTIEDVVAPARSDVLKIIERELLAALGGREV